MDITQYIAQSVLPVSAALWVLGNLILRPVKQIPNEFIPVILMLLGIALSIGIFKGDIVTATVQGILAAGCAILADQTTKQMASYLTKE